ncbi:leucine-rich repeat flightless-interacting protein 1 isoform X7 [Neopsephotus bourkii]|uniref:leucine-rich repeat flightless-interacting protein 1 isoform X7 n=1 Tax=Neopsephotus bourkii TaxID=309878 RepID=UPI002AA58168|nr:leucine-rich repeat flightless-interacting protein 1 isoform X7 [Neopsephotus bourkii]
MGTQGAGRKRLPNRERLTAEDDALNQIAREAEARLAAKRAARAEAREIRMRELERQQKEEDSERYSRRARRNASASDEDERMSVGSRGSLRSHLEHANTYPVAGLENERTKKKNYSKATNGYEDDVYGSSQSRKSSRASYYSDLGLHNSGYASTSQPSSQNGNWPSLLCSDAPARSYRASVYDESVYSGSRRYSASSSRAPSEYSCYLGSGSRASSRASSARASPVIEERPEKDFEKGARTVSSLSAATLASLGGTSSRRGSGDTSISADTEASIREIKDSLAEVEEKYKKAMVSNAQLDNEKTNFMYQVDTLKDALLELEEQLAESRRQYEEKSKEFEREKHAHSILQFQFMEIKEALKQREEMLAEIQQLQQKQQSYVREISDLQETIEWKDKKIGALERQKDFFDSIRSERDDLRDEVVVLKEQLKKHGIIPNSDVATNGETSDILDNEGHLDSSKTIPGTTQALKTGGDGMLGKASEVDMKNEILEDMGKREILQNTEHEEHKEESEEQELHADENAKAQKMVEERDALSAVTLPDSGFTVQIQSLTEHVSGSTSSNDDSGADDLRKVAESAGTAVQQPVSTEAEHCDLNAMSDQNLEVGSLQGHQMFDTPQEMHSDLGTEPELEKAAPQQQEQEDLESSHVLSDNEMDQEANITSESCVLASNQAGLPEITAAGLVSEEVKVESHTETLQHSEESAKNQVTSVLEEKFVEGQDSTSGGAGETGDRAEQENEVGNTVQGQSMETEPVGLEGMEACGSGVPAAEIEEEGGGHQAFIQPVSAEDSPSASSEKQNMQYESELENAVAEKDGQKEALTEELEMCSDSAETGKQDKISVEAVDCITEVEGSVLQQAEPDREIVVQVMTQETSFDPSLLDDRIKESELETGDESGTEKESRTEWVEDTKLKVGVQTVQSSEEAIGGTVGEKNTPFKGEAQNVAKQEEGESKEESTVDVSVATGKKVSKETPEENEQELELADHHGDGCTSEEGANNSLAQKAESDANVSEHIILEDQAKERLEGDGGVFGFDQESKQILETDKKCDEEKAYTQKYEGHGTKGAAGKTAQTDEAGEGKGKIETEDILTKTDSLQQKKADEPEETGEASWKTEEKTDVMEDEIKASDSNKVEKIPGENVMEQDLESAGNNREESKEDLQSGRRGKGRSRDDCTIS